MPFGKISIDLVIKNEAGRQTYRNTTEMHFALLGGASSLRIAIGGV